MEQYIKTYKEQLKKLKAYEYAIWLMGWDKETETPSQGYAYADKQFGVLAEAAYNLESDPQYVKAIEYLYDHLDALEDADFKVEIKKAKKGLRIVQKVPKQEYLDYQMLIQSSLPVWVKAKQANDFSMFAPTLEKIIAFNRKLVAYLETDELKGYDVLLDFYEEGTGMKAYDHFFDTLKEELVPFVQDVTKTKLRFPKRLKFGPFPVDKQREFADYLMDVFGYDQSKGLLKESAHPFTSGVTSTDTRITTHYYEDNIRSSIFSVIHEMGHGIYEQQNDAKYDETALHGGTTLGIHESQSRMFENMIGRSFAFWETHYNKLVSLFPKQLKNISLLDFYKFINEAKKSLIRIEADELTYSLHILVRYEIEKALISGKLKVKDLPKRWNYLYSKYVGKRPKTDAEGVLQDIHWAHGSIGYFPTYALGSACAAQIYDAMNKDINVETAVRTNKIELINQWLKEHIHQFASSKTPEEIMVFATGKPFDPQYYVDYLKRKFSQL